MSSGKAVQGERTAIFAHLLRFFWLVSRCFAGMVRRGQKLSPRRNETPEKNFFKTARILGSRAPQGSGKLSQYLFQRTGEGRTPIEAVRTLSVPQMISGKAKETIEELIGSNLEKRFEHHVQQAMK